MVFFAGFLTEAGMKRAQLPTAAVPVAARTSLAAVPGGHNFSPGCTRLYVSLSE